MKVLLDTHTFLWWIDDAPNLSDKAREILTDAGNTIFVSVASGWEIAIKTGIGRLQVEGDPERLFPEQIARNAFQTLPIQMSHALHTVHLPYYHRDPFDRLLVSQSQIEDLPIVTRDPAIGHYEVETIW
ncbi:MAG: type II toxin-antitoxin system VapC family toxin [Anaerolineales bacterium]|nr:type II toxin-antitoxin system VapC family toxin [Anaerolineales bacterium]